MDRKLNVTIKDTVWDPTCLDHEHVYYYRAGDKYLYKVWIFLDGLDVPFISKATYTLHETFPNRHISASRTLENPNCQIIIYTWGTFTINATVEEKSGRKFSISHEMQWINSLPTESEKYRALTAIT